MLRCVFLERGSTPEESKTDMAYIYLNAGLAAVGTLVIATVIVGIACLMKRTIIARYKQTVFYNSRYCFLLLALFQFTFSPVILNGFCDRLWLITDVSI